MSTATANHLLLSTNLKCASGKWVGETSSWTMRFSVGGGGGPGNADRPDLAAGNITLNTFDCHTDVTSRSLTCDTLPGTMAGAWSGDDLPAAEKITAGDIDFLFGVGVKFLRVLLPFMPIVYELQNMKLYAVGSDGKAPLGPNTWTSTAVTKGTTGSYLSPEVALVVSWYSAHRQKAGRGRTFVGPFQNTALSTDGVFDPGMCVMIRDAGKAVQDSVRTRGTPQSSAVYCGIIWNRHAPGQSSGPGLTGSVINKVRVGDEPDHQERRTKSRPETYIEANVV